MRLFIAEPNTEVIHAQRLKLSTYLEGRGVVNMEIEEGMLEDRPMVEGGNRVEVIMPLDSVDTMVMPLNLVHTMGMHELLQGTLWRMHHKEELMGEEMQSTKRPEEEPKKLHMVVQMVQTSFPVSTTAEAHYRLGSTTE
ncbi:hypothetical protein ACJRO7_034672 [Eucalyptus globulus]|uniref:Uncharacterized protein n=1 Tax=Eucalyptus globulus TaxID=34317 RepID=A0ABD3J791_EUCGL